MELYEKSLDKEAYKNELNLYLFKMSTQNDIQSLFSNIIRFCIYSTDTSTVLSLDEDK